MFLPFCFMLALFLVSVSFVFVSFLVCFQTIKTLFPCSSSVFSHVGYKAVYFLSFMVLFLFVSSCVVCFHFKQLTCMSLCLCCLFLSVFFVAGLSGFVIYILWLCFFVVVLFWIFVLFIVFCCQSSQKRPKKPDTATPPSKKTIAEKRPNCFSVSAVVLTK